MTGIIIFLLAVVLFGLFEESIYYTVNRRILETEKANHPFTFIKTKLRARGSAS